MKKTNKPMEVVAARIPHIMMLDLENRSCVLRRPISQLVRFAIEEYLQRKDGAK